MIILGLVNLTNLSKCDIDANLLHELPSVVTGRGRIHDFPTLVINTRHAVTRRVLRKARYLPEGCQNYREVSNSLMAGNRYNTLLVTP